MNNTILKNIVGFGVLLWFIGYLLGILFFMIVPSSLIGWFISPIGIAITLWVLMKKSLAVTFTDFIITGIIWLLIAVFLDYLFIVKLLQPADGYYKPDVYFYYLTTFALPVIVGMKKNESKQ